MKGIKFRGRLNDINDPVQIVGYKWCVQPFGKQVHIWQRRTIRGRKIDLQITACDGSCLPFEEVPADLAALALDKLY